MQRGLDSENIFRFYISPSLQIYQQTNVATPAVLPGQVLPLPPSIPGLLVPPLLTNTLPSSAATAAQPASGLANAHAFVARYTGRNGPVFSTLPAQQ